MSLLRGKTRPSGPEGPGSSPRSLLTSALFGAREVADGVAAPLRQPGEPCPPGVCPCRLKRPRHGHEAQALSRGGNRGNRDAACAVPGPGAGQGGLPRAPGRSAPPPSRRSPALLKGQGEAPASHPSPPWGPSPGRRPQAASSALPAEAQASPSLGLLSGGPGWTSGPQGLTPALPPPGPGVGLGLPHLSPLAQQE